MTLLFSTSLKHRGANRTPTCCWADFMASILSPLPRPELVVKKLRYYARYIVVCLLLNKMDLVKVLVKVWEMFCVF